VALCELVAQTLPGATITDAEAIGEVWLLASLSEIPHSRRGRATLVAEALRVSLRLHC
jgi:hypothetical protein